MGRNSCPGWVRGPALACGVGRMHPERTPAPNQNTEKGGCMKSRVFSRGLILLAALVLSFPAWAAPMKKTIHIRQTLQVGDTTLEPGDYNLVVDGNEATFQRGRKVVAKVSCAMKERGGKYSRDAVIYDNATITEIRLAGQSQVVTFVPMTRAASPSKSTSSVQ